jgi:hypothetical protein
MTTAGGTGVHLPTGLYIQARFFAATRAAWKQLGDFETITVRDEIENISIRKPVYVAGLARSGTTKLTEMLEKHPELTSHHYSDFPNVWTPYWRNYLMQKTRVGELRETERAHNDRIRITNDSPEAVEEVLWMHFFPSSHTDGLANILDETTSNPVFESFYRDHLRKLLAIRGKPRYLAKGNYNLARFLYLLKIFPDARLIIPYRHPINHIASLIKQHSLFLRAHLRDPRIGRQLGLSGHFEFGPNRRAINFGDADLHRAVQSAWQEGREVEGWALYWAGTYQFLLDQVRSYRHLAQASLFVRYEDLCVRSAETIDRIIEHSELEKRSFADLRAYYSAHLCLPEYYQPDFTPHETRTIMKICEPTLMQLGKL